MQTTVAESTHLDNLLDEVFGISAQSAARQAWREAVATVSAKAKVALPDANGRIEKAEQLVLSGDVEIMADGKARVASQSNGTTQYVVCNGTCECKDFSRAPSGWCKHRIAAGILKRANARLVKANGQTPAQSQPAPTSPLPEAPASVNVHLTIGGRQVQLTLRDSDESRLLARLDAVLQRFPVGVASTDTTPQCPKHGVPLKLNHGKNGSTWYSHRTAEGWCKGK